MSMYRQLWLAVIMSTLLALIGGLLGSTLNARVYLQEQLGMKNEDNAAALALMLSGKKPDAVEVELAVAALFDSGHFELIRVVDPFGKTIIERQAPLGQYDAPQWFVRLLPIQPAQGRAQISDGWKQFGTVILASHSRFAYRALWRGAVELASILAFAGLISGYLGTLILRRLRRPLQSVIDQARAITERRFITITEPKVPELRQLAAAMNITVGRLKAMFEEEAARLETVRHEANSDPLTGLANRTYFMARLRGELEGENAGGGALIMVRVANLAEINHKLGREATDDMLRRFGGIVSGYAGQQADGLAARLNGADFAALLPAPAPARELAEEMLQALVRERTTFEENGPVAFIGVGSFTHGVEAGSLLAQVDAALAAVEAEGINGVRETIAQSGGDIPKSAEEWSLLIHRALSQHWVCLASFPVTDLSGHLVHRESPLRLRFDAHGEWLPAGRFLPFAERLKLMPRLDMAALSLGLEELAREPALTGLAINLSASSLQDLQFRHDLRNLMLRHGDAARRLWLEVAEGGAFRHFDAFRSFCQDLSGTGCRIGLEHFGRQFSQIGQLHDLGLDFLKIDASFIQGIEANPGNQAFLKGLCGIAHSIGLQVFAEGVVSSAELEALKLVGLDGATGPAIRDRNP